MGHIDAGMGGIDRQTLEHSHAGCNFFSSAVWEAHAPRYNEGAQLRSQVKTLGIMLPLYVQGFKEGH